MTHDTFILIAQTARELRTEAATYALLEAYAQNGCATYPADSELFRELWPHENTPGFVLTTTATPIGNKNIIDVSYAEIEPRTTHTPGPWVASDNGHILVDEESDYWKRRLEYTNRGNGVEGWRIASMESMWTQEDIANARLIAAAPETKRQRDELLTALKAVLEVTENGTCINPRHEREPVIENALAAVAKAEGGEE